MSRELYAPALGGIMLSIGIRLSIDDFALAFKRFTLLHLLKFGCIGYELACENTYVFVLCADLYHYPLDL